jgi:hypothetical protein
MTEEEHTERVREIAQRLYEEEGRPEGCAYEHWKRAERMALSEQGGGEIPPQSSGNNFPV